VHAEAYDTVIGCEFTLVVPSANKHYKQTLSYQANAVLP